MPFVPLAHAEALSAPLYSSPFLVHPLHQLGRRTGLQHPSTDGVRRVTLYHRNSGPMVHDNQVQQGIVQLE